MEKIWEAFEYGEVWRGYGEGVERVWTLYESHTELEKAEGRRGQRREEEGRLGRRIVWRE